VALPAAVPAAPTAYTRSVAFLAALPGPATTADFDSLTTSAPIPSGSTADGLAFSYDFDGVSLVATAGALDGSGFGFTTTSAPHALGTTDLDVLVDGDDLALGFAAANALGLFVITAETPGISLFDGDIRLTAGGATAALDVDAEEATLADGSRVYFLGVADPAATFGEAGLGTFGGGGAFAFNVDDVVTALPEPGIAAGLAAALIGLGAGPWKGAPRRTRAPGTSGEGR